MKVTRVLSPLLVCLFACSASAEQLKGMMLNTGLVAEDDIRTLASWGGKLARYQIGMEYHPKPGMPVQEDLDLWFSHLHRHLDNLDDVLVWGEKYGVKVMIDVHVTPGGKFKPAEMKDLPQEEMKGDNKMFHVAAFRDAYLKAWREIATRYCGRKIVYGYDLVNEPKEQPGSKAKFTYWDVQEDAIKAIRAIDPTTPIVVSANWGDGPISFLTLKPFPHDNIIYQVHMYRPQSYTLQSWDMTKPIDPANRYPDPAKGFDRNYLVNELKPVRDFERKYGAKIICGEWSCASWAPGCEKYIEDVAAILDEYGWDWTYGCIREAAVWSIEHECYVDEKGVRRFRKSADNPRRRVILKALNRKGAGK